VLGMVSAHPPRGSLQGVAFAVALHQLDLSRKNGLLVLVSFLCKDYQSLGEILGHSNCQKWPPDPWNSKPRLQPFVYPVLVAKGAESGAI